MNKTLDINSQYQQVIRLTTGGKIDRARTLLKEIAGHDVPLLKDLHDAIIRDTGRAIL